MFDSPTFDFDSYIKYRPPYSDKLYAEIYQYHNSHGGQWNLAHDAGTGAGIVAEELSTKFTTVAASDPSAFYLEQAKRRLSSRDKFRFGCYPGEDMSWLPDAGVDMITMAEAIHWAEPQDVVTAASKALKPGGTLAIWHYGVIPIFVGSTEAQDVFNELFDYWSSRVVAGTPETKLANLERAVRVTVLRMSEIEFDKSEWKAGVRRIYWNAYHPTVGITHQTAFKDVQVQENPDDVVERRIDKTILSQYADIDWIRGYMNHLYPDVPENAIEQGMFEKLARIMEGRKLQLSWTVTMILATKSD
ncbi:methyltransferase [Trichophyton mentagrophytes]|nr:methyltransferase [Trichophyton mentagrophytes]